MKNKYLVRFVCILLAACSIGGLFWEKINSGASLKNNQHAGYILPGNVISQEFQYRTGMTEVGVNIATFARKNNCTVILELKKKENGESVAKRELNAESLIDNNFVFDFYSSVDRLDTSNAFFFHCVEESMREVLPYAHRILNNKKKELSYELGTIGKIC